jgi:hypothetical protein
MGELRNAYELLVGKPEEKRPLGRSRHRCEDIRMDLKEIGLEGVELDSAGSGYEQVTGSLEHGNEPMNYIKGGEFFD